MRGGARAALCAILLAGAASAHDGVVHGDAEEAARHRAETAPPLADEPPPLPFPVAIGGAYELIDQTGAPRTEADPDGRLQLVFFGYANCPSICAVAMPTMAASVDALRAAGVDAVPVMITVDPERDRVETMAEPLAKFHPDFIGLTGSEEALAAARKAFHVEKSLVFEDPEYGPVYAHGSHIYLMDADGGFLTLLPPVLSPERIVEIAGTYLG